MKIYQCARCAGCGYLAGAFRWEVPWSQWAPNPSDPQHEGGVLEAQPCPDCGGTGALIQADAVAASAADLPTRRGVPRAESYAEHVATVLNFQKAQQSH